MPLDMEGLSEVNAKRIAVCLNAFAGLPDHEIPGPVQFKKMLRLWRLEIEKSRLLEHAVE